MKNCIVILSILSFLIGCQTSQLEVRQYPTIISSVSDELIAVGTDISSKEYVYLSQYIFWGQSQQIDSNNVIAGAKNYYSHTKDLFGRISPFVKGKIKDISSQNDLLYINFGSKFDFPFKFNPNFEKFFIDLDDDFETICLDSLGNEVKVKISEFDQIPYLLTLRTYHQSKIEFRDDAKGAVIDSETKPKIMRLENQNVKSKDNNPRLE